MPSLLFKFSLVKLDKVNKKYFDISINKNQKQGQTVNRSSVIEKKRERQINRQKYVQTRIIRITKQLKRQKHIKKLQQVFFLVARQKRGSKGRATLNKEHF